MRRSMGRVMATAGALGLLLLVCGCATQAQRQFQAISTNNKATSEQIQVCATSVYNSPEAASLRPHIPLKPFDATLEQMSDSSVANDQEINAILTVHPRTQESRKVYLSELSQSTPSLVPIYVATYNKNEDNILALIQKKLTWGEFVKQQRDAATDAQRALQAEGQRIVAGLKQDHQAEIEQRQRAAEAVSQWAQTQQMINALNHPAPTFYAAPPMTSPSSLNCMSNRTGNTVITNCN
jgi:hypothetical protein